MSDVRSDGKAIGVAGDVGPTVEQPPEPNLPGAVRVWRRAGMPAGLGGLALVVLVLLCGATMVLGFVNKDRCTGPDYDSLGRSEPNFLLRSERDVCYSDIQYLWVGRDIDQHVFPYIDGGIRADGQLFGGAVEYPVLTGILMWLGAIFAHNDHQFLIDSAILLAPFGLAVAWMLGRLARWRALVWALGPPLVLYAFHNWDLAVVACAVGAAYVVHRGWGRAGANRSLAARATVAGVLLGLGFAFKLYPIIFTVPLMLYVATGGEGGRWLPAGRRWDVVAPIRVAVAAVGTALVVNLPFMLLGFNGWAASFTFQEDREVDITTNSIWFWAFRPYSNPTNKDFQSLIDLLSPGMIMVSFVVACALGWRRYRREGSYPWLAVSAAMLCGFLLFHKVHSPQYTLWLVPMFVLMRIRWQWIAAYFAADLAMGIGVFRYYYAISFGKPYGIYDGFAEQATVIGVWGRAVLLLALFFAFLAAPMAVHDPDGTPAVTAPEPVPAT
ncbi:MAG TPA: hypothetical protein VHW44_00280 [Pseudonocardiaceae bacterium]|nr:hypothetical protein [Pseudonocardiaceae bacterium]